MSSTVILSSLLIGRQMVDCLFSDCNVHHVNGKLLTSVYRKSPFSGLGGSFFSFCSFNVKLNSVSSLLSLGHKISSTYLDMCDEFDFLRLFFTNNGFPLSLINSWIKKFLCKIFVPQSDVVSSVNKFYFTLPYFGAQSEKMKSELSIL